MSSKFSVKNFSKDQETLQNAADALSDYLRIAAVWTIGLSVLFYARYDSTGVVMSLITNLLIVAWIYYSYLHSFEIAAKSYGLQIPTVSLF
jgi:Zn-dependent protease with chaperone function